MKKAPTGSLARRVVFICLALLVVPLLLHTLFLYKEEYNQELADTQLTIRVIGEAQRALLQERVELEWAFLDTIALDLHVHKGNGLQITEIPLPKGASNHFLFLDQQKEHLLVGKEMPEGRAIVMATPLPKLLEQLTHFEDAPFPIFLALVRFDGSLLAGEKKEDAIWESFSLKNANFSLFLTVPKRQIRDLHLEEIVFRSISLLLFLSLLGGASVWLLTRRVARPLKALCFAMQRVAEGALHVRYQPDRMGFEINELGKEFNRTLDSLMHQSQEMERERILRERLAQEMRIGHQIQAGLLPTHLPEAKGLDIAPGFLPAKEVGGDFYNLFFLNNGSIFFAVVDTADKGIPACLYALGLRSILRSFAMMSSDLSEIILRANDLFWRDVKNTGMFATLWGGVYDPEKRLLTYCCQGHAPAYLKRGKAIEALKTEGIALGATKLDTISTNQISLMPGDLLFLYTDGVIEAHDPDGQRYGQKRLSEFLLRCKESSAAHLVERVFEEIHLYAQGSPQHDDMTLLVIRLL